MASSLCQRVFLAGLLAAVQVRACDAPHAHTSTLGIQAPSGLVWWNQGTVHIVVAALPERATTTHKTHTKRHPHNARATAAQQLISSAALRQLAKDVALSHIVIHTVLPHYCVTAMPLVAYRYLGAARRRPPRCREQAGHASLLLACIAWHPVAHGATD
jgi:hypothetical protein